MLQQPAGSVVLLPVPSHTLLRTRGSHHQFVHPTKVGTITVPHRYDGQPTRQAMYFLARR
jgi:hypothetical protein